MAQAVSNITGGSNVPSRMKPTCRYVAIIKVVVPDSAALPLGTLLNGFFIRALLEKHERTLPRALIYQSVSALYNAFR